MLELVAMRELQVAQGTQQGWHRAGRHRDGAPSCGQWHFPNVWHSQHTSVGLTRMRDDVQSPLSQNPGQRMYFWALSTTFWHLSYHHPP